MRRLLISSLLLLSACSSFSTGQGDIYDMRREAQVAYAGNQDERAEKLLIGLTRSAPSDAEAWFYLGNLYARSNRPDKAAEAYQKAVMLGGGDAKTWNNLGVVRLREAWAAFIQAYSMTPAGDPMQAKLEALIAVMEKIPLEGFTRSGKSAAPAAATSEKASEKK